MKRSAWSTLLLLLFVGALVVAPLVLPEFHITLLNYIGLYAIVALGLVMLTGVGGLTSFGQAAFAGLGAYASAYLTTAYGVSPWLTLPTGLLVTAVVALRRFWLLLERSEEPSILNLGCGITAADEAFCRAGQSGHSGGSRMRRAERR